MMNVVQSWAASNSFNDWISLIASACSIIALPIAIVQILLMKHKVNATADGIREILSIREHEKLEAVLADIKAQHNELTKLENLLKQKGISSKVIEEKVNSIVEVLNRSMCDMPITEANVAKSLRGAITGIREYQGKDNLKDAEAYLYTAIQELKTSIEKCREKEIEKAKKQ